MKKGVILKAEADKQQQVLKAQATAEALDIIAEKLQSDPNAREALQFLLTQQYLMMGETIGSSESSKVMFMDPRSIVSTLEGMRSVISNSNGEYSELEQALEKIDRHSAR
jgi:regulator of protease activity HflC (stomatin/prohibitin superfamily)